MAEFRGKLYIFVDASQAADDEPAAKDPEDIFSARDPGDALWYRIGWAISNNARASYCARTSRTKLRAFETFIECMDFVRKRTRQSRSKARFYPVYEVDGQKCIVTSLEQILRRDGQHVRSPRPDPAELALDTVSATLAAKVGKIVATNALVLLRTLDREGETAARALFSPATYERLWQILHEAGLSGLVRQSVGVTNPDLE